MNGGTLASGPGNRLPVDRSFRDSLWPFAAAYFGYVAGKALQPFLGPDLSALTALVAGAAALWVYRSRHPWAVVRAERVGRQAWLAAGLAAFPLTALWIGLLWLGRGAPPLPIGSQETVQTGTEFSLAYGVLRLMGSVAVVPLAEEIFLRVWALECFQAAFAKDAAGRRLGFGAALDARPPALNRPPLAWSAQIPAALLFALGHSPTSFPAAIGYFLASNLLYARTRSLAAVIAAHALVNAALAALVLGFGWHWLWE